MRVEKITTDRIIGGIPIIGRENVLKALDLYLENPPTVRGRSGISTLHRNPRIVYGTPETLSNVTGKEMFLEKLRELIIKELERDRYIYHCFERAVEPFNNLRLSITVVDKEKDIYVVEVCRGPDETFNEQLAKLHNTERAIASINVKVYLTRNGDEIKIDFEELMRLLDAIEELKTKDLKGEDVLGQMTARGRKEDTFKLETYNFDQSCGLKTQMNFHSIPENYPLSQNSGVCRIVGRILVAPLEEYSSPDIGFKICGNVQDSPYLNGPIYDHEMKKKAASTADKIVYVFNPFIESKGETSQEKPPTGFWSRLGSLLKTRIA